MASTAIKTEEEKKEYFDSPKELDEKIEKLADLIKKSKNFVAFTGAGISTASGIPDYRSGVNTVLPTGAGCWEAAANIQKAKQNRLSYQSPQKQKAQTKIFNYWNMHVAPPSLCHMSLVELMEKGFLKHIISQNIDGLHRKSGIPSDKIIELHGNQNLEICETCKKGYMRDFRVRTASKFNDHKTGRKCDDPQCRGLLNDSIINFGESLNLENLLLGYMLGGTADLMVSLGSSLRVNPAADMAMQTHLNGHDFVIINLQKTPLDKYASLRIFAKIDDVFKILMQKLNLTIPEFKLYRYLKIDLDEREQTLKENELKIKGIDQDGSPFTIFRKVEVKQNSVNQKDFEIELEFQKNYNEPKLIIQMPRNILQDNRNQIELKLTFNIKGSWENVQLYDSKTQKILYEQQNVKFKQIPNISKTNSTNRSVSVPNVQSVKKVIPANNLMKNYFPPVQKAQVKHVTNQFNKMGIKNKK